MKKILTFTLLAIAIAGRSQVTFTSLIINAKKSELPFDSTAKNYDDSKIRVLNEQQRLYVLNKLRTIETIRIFETTYAEIEPIECNDCLDLSANDQLHLITYFKWGNDFLLYLRLNKGEKTRGLLAFVNSKGEWISWFVSDGSIWSDGIISVGRNVDIAENGNININENYFDGKRDIHNYAFLYSSGTTPEGKDIPFGKFHIVNKTNNN